MEYFLEQNAMDTAHLKLVTTMQGELMGRYRKNDQKPF